MSSIKIKIDVKKLPKSKFSNDKKDILPPVMKNTGAREKTKTYQRKKCRGKIWTYDEEQEMLDGLAEGLSFEEIANRLNRTVEAVRNRTYRIKERGRAIK